MANLMMKIDVLATGQFPGYFLKRGSVTVPKILICRGLLDKKHGNLPSRGGVYQFRLWATSLKVSLCKRSLGDGLQARNAFFHNPIPMDSMRNQKQENSRKFVGNLLVFQE